MILALTYTDGSRRHVRINDVDINEKGVRALTTRGFTIEDIAYRFAKRSKAFMRANPILKSVKVLDMEGRLTLDEWEWPDNE